MYHISRKYLGRSVELTPRIPKFKYLDPNRPNPTTLRICISPTVEQCILGIQGILMPCYIGYSDLPNVFGKNVGALVKYGDDKGELLQPWALYHTNETGVKSNVFDEELTGERWLLEPTKFTFVGFIHWDKRYYHYTFCVIDHSGNLIPADTLGAGCESLQPKKTRDIILGKKAFSGFDKSKRHKVMICRTTTVDEHMITRYELIHMQKVGKYWQKIKYAEYKLERNVIKAYNKYLKENF